MRSLRTYIFLLAAGMAWMLSVGCPAEAADQEILNVSYDVSREFYKDYNAAFIRHWHEATGQSVTVRQSHGGSSKQAHAVLAGLEADVVTMNQETDIDVLYELGNLLSKDWRVQFPHNSVPYVSTTVFLVRKGNPKGIRDWEDLVKPGVSVIIPNPKTSGNGRYSYLAAWGQVAKRGGDDKKARAFVSLLFHNAPVLDTGGRGATTTFMQRRIGDVLLTFENEVALIRKESETDNFDIVYPSISILVEMPVTVVDRVVDKHGTREVAQAYLQYLYSEEGQEIAAKHFYRPRLASVAAKHAKQFPGVKVFAVGEVFGSWKTAQQTHFADGGVFDQIYKPSR